jgi:enoyl-CoA hydratase
MEASAGALAPESFETVAVEAARDRVVVTLDRPEKRNAIDARMVAEMHEVCAALEAEPRILVIAGSGGVFAAGADIGQMRERRRADALRGINSGLFERIARLPLPAVAAIDGVALGAGSELAYACDIRLGTARSRIGNPEPGLGIMAAAGACWRLPRIVGDPLAREMLLAGRVLDGEEAAAAGLLAELVEPDELMARAHALVDRIGRGSKLALQLTKLALRAPPDAHPTFDDVAQAVLFETDEKYERMTAFLERRPRSGA